MCVLFQPSVDQVVVNVVEGTDFPIRIRIDRRSDFDSRLVTLSPKDNICVVAQRLAAGETVAVAGEVVTIAETLPIGHKIAVRAITAGETVLKYGAPIGSATAEIAVGEHVHVHNLQSDYIPTYDREGEGAFKG